jgi:hypothetical protein
MQGTGLIGILGQVHWMPDLGLSGCKVLEKVYILGRMCWADWRYWAGRVPCVQLYWAGWEYWARGTDLSVCTAGGVLGRGLPSCLGGLAGWVEGAGWVDWAGRVDWSGLVNWAGRVDWSGWAE